MPQAISNLIIPSREESSTSVDEQSSSRFVRDFNVRPNVIIYHSHMNLEKQETDFSMQTSTDRELNRLKSPGHEDEETQT